MCFVITEYELLGKYLTPININIPHVQGIINKIYSSRRPDGIIEFEDDGNYGSAEMAPARPPATLCV
jgi:hypothetical protein